MFLDKNDDLNLYYKEDVWAGGGNLGPSVEAFVGGLEVGNMVFMQYKTLHDGSYEELDIKVQFAIATVVINLTSFTKVIDVGIGLERIPWLINGSVTSYEDTFPTVLKYLRSKLDIKIDEQIWEKFGPYSCLLDVDEAEDINKVWDFIAGKLEVTVEELKKAILMVKDLYIIADHTRTAMMIIQDGSLPSNTGGGSNLRNVIRRVFGILNGYGWWSTHGLDGFLEIFEHQRKDLEELYGKSKPFPSFEEIIKYEYERWSSTDVIQKNKLERMLKKKNELTLKDWAELVKGYGVPLDTISKMSGQPIPNDIYNYIATLNPESSKAPEIDPYNTTHLPETNLLSYKSQNQLKFQAKILDIFVNLAQNNLRNIVILDESAFYPTSGGQQHDTGTLCIDDELYHVVNVEKVGKVSLHTLDRSLPKPGNSYYIGRNVTGQVDEARRKQLRNHHTATHILFAACRKVLGPHVWQNGAKKTVEQAHLDITHYGNLTRSQEIEIENAVNQIILEGKNISKSYIEKAQAEQEYGFRLYQGGVVPGNELRVVNIEDTDVEACCGTHCDNTSEVGWFKLIKTMKIQDGLIRLYYVAGEKAIQLLNKERGIVTSLQDLWSVSQDDVISTAERIFKDYKKVSQENSRHEEKILNLQVRYLLDNPEFKSIYYLSDQDNATIYFSFLQNYAKDLRVTILKLNRD